MRRQPMDVLGHDCLLAVRNAVLPQIALAEVGGDDLEVGAGVDARLTAWRRTAAQSLTAATGNTCCPGQTASRHAVVADRRGAAAHAGTFPIGTREALPRLLRGRLCGAIEIQQPCLRAGVVLELQRVVVLPRDPQPSRLTIDAANAERAALVAALIVGLEIPGLRHAARLLVDGNAGGSGRILRRRHHAPAPVLRHHRYPRAAEVHRAARPRRLRRGGRARATLAARAALGGHVRAPEGNGGDDQEEGDRRKEEGVRREEEGVSSHVYLALLVAAPAFRAAARSL